ncbi:hypothetical protein ACLKA7_012641 [Drosophila subpalustris]
MGLIPWTTALVHYKKLEKGANGCKLGDKEFGVGETVKDPNTCGVYVCQNTEGDSLIHYCQKPAPFELCQTDGVSTVTDFPQCCWMCVTYISCGEATKEPETGDSSGTTATTTDSTGTPSAETEPPNTNDTNGTNDGNGSNGTDQSTDNADEPTPEPTEPDTPPSDE